MQMAEQAIVMCSRALDRQEHHGYTEWFVRDLISHQLNVQASISREKPAVDHGLFLSQTVCDIRIHNRRLTGRTAEDATWIAAARGNLAVSLMAVGRPQEALTILLELLGRADMKSNEDIYLCNTALCLMLMDRLDDAKAYANRAMASIRIRDRDGGTAQMAV